MPYQPMDGPIPGENFTTDTKNFPWHRPPQYTNMDDAVEAVMKKVFDDESSGAFLTMIEMGFTIVSVAQLLVMSGVGAGKWSVDFGILLAGPVAHILVIMCRSYGIDFELGIDPESKTPTTSFFRAAAKVDPEEVQERLAGEDVAAGEEETDGDAPEELTPPPPSTGLGGKPTPPTPEQAEPELEEEEV